MNLINETAQDTTSSTANVHKLTVDALNFIARINKKPDDTVAGLLHVLVDKFKTPGFVMGSCGVPETVRRPCTHYRWSGPLKDIYPSGMLVSNESVIVVTDEGSDRRVMNTAFVPVHNLMRFCPFCGAPRESWRDPNI